MLHVVAVVDCASVVEGGNDEAAAVANPSPIAVVDGIIADAAAHPADDAADAAGGEGPAVVVEAAADSSANCVLFLSSQPWSSVFGFKGGGQSRIPHSFLSFFLSRFLSDRTA
jgi:hypothetical protein